VPYFFATFHGKNYYTDTLDLADLAAHNLIEHDASLVRADAAHNPDQAVIQRSLVERLLQSATGPDGKITAADLAKQLSIRRVESQESNKDFSLSILHKGFGSIK
jgi:hypothetical protein